MRSALFLTPLSLLFIWIASPLRADEIVKKDGTALSGRVVAETEQTVTLEVFRDGIAARVPVAVSAIRSRVKSATPATRPSSIASPTSAPATRTAQTRERYRAELGEKEARRKQDLADARADREQRQTQWEEDQKAYMENVRPDIEQVDRELESVKAQGRAVEMAMASLESQFATAMRDVERDYRDAMTEANSSYSAGRIQALRARARQQYDQDQQTVRLQFQPQRGRLERELGQLTEQLRTLEARRKGFTDAAPKAPK